MYATRYLIVALVAGCGTASGVVEDVASEAGERPGRGVEAPYREAAEATGVPADLLVAIALAETGGRMVVGEQEFPGQARAWGAMGLRDDILAEAAALSGLDEDLVRRDLDANVLAAASWLADEALLQGIPTGDLGAWAPVVAAYSGIADPEAQASYVHEAVYARLRDGAALEGARLPRHDVLPDFAEPRVAGRLGVDAAGVVWRASPNYNSRGGAAVDFVIIHTCEGVYSGCWGWLTNASAGVSAHYVVNDDGSEVSQLVAESDRAWHISASYDCANNDGVECSRNGTSMNTVSVGIEHAGYASQASWDPGLIQRSAELTCGITQRQTVPRDRYHIVAHGKLQPWNRTDPGPNWPWTDYLAKVGQACGDGGTPPVGQRIIDSNDAANEPGRAEMDVSSAWVSSTNVPGFWNTGYFVAPTEAVSDPARFRFLVDASTCYDVDAWWTAASDRAANATYLARDPSGAEIGRATVDQRARGAQWNGLGTWRFPAGWNEVALSRWTAVGSYVVADAVRLTPSTDCPPACGDGALDAGEACDDGDLTGGDGCSSSCAVEALALLPVVPGQAGVQNTIEAQGAQPGATVRVYGSRRAGSTAVPGCPGLTMPLKGAAVLGGAVAGADTHAMLVGRPAAALAGSSWRLVAVDEATCRVSPVLGVTL